MTFWKKRKRTVTPPPPTPPSETQSQDSTVSQFLTGDALRDQRSIEELLEELAEITKRVASVAGRADLRELLTHVVDASIRKTGAGRGLLVIEGEGGDLRVEVARKRRGKELCGEVPFSHSVVRKVLDSGVGWNRAFPTEQEAMDFAKSLHDLDVRSLMCVPFVVGGGERAIRGVLYVDSRRVPFEDNDLSYFTILSQQIAVVLEIARLHVDSLERLRLDQAYELAGEIQRRLMPSAPRDVPGLDLGRSYLPAERASGDFHGFVRMERGAVGVLVGDVAGHGIGPALVAASIQGSLISLLEIANDPARALTAVNRQLVGRLEESLFVSVCLVVIEADGGVRVASAGHPPPLVWTRATGEVRALEEAGPALGITPDFVYDQGGPCRLTEGDMLVVYTDGITESRSREDPKKLFGVVGLCASLESRAPECRNAAGLIEAIAADVDEFTDGSAEDDVTLVAVRRSGGDS